MNTCVQQRLMVILSGGLVFAFAATLNGQTLPLVRGVELQPLELFLQRLFRLRQRDHVLPVVLDGVVVFD